MIVTIFHRLEGSPEAPAPAFPDVRADFYYAQPIAWAEANGIVTGYEDGTFGPEDNITREQLAAFCIARYHACGTPLALVPWITVPTMEKNSALPCWKSLRRGWSMAKSARMRTHICPERSPFRGP